LVHITFKIHILTWNFSFSHWPSWYTKWKWLSITIKYAPEDQYKTQLTNIHEF